MLEHVPHRSALHAETARLRSAGLLFALTLLSARGAATQPLPDSPCASCGAHPAGAKTRPEGTASGRPAASRAACDVEEHPLSRAADRAFRLKPLRGFLDGPITVEGHLGEAQHVAGRARQSATPIEAVFGLGKFTYYKMSTNTVDCVDQVKTSAHIKVRVGGSLLRLEADGVLWKLATDASAHFYARTDLAAATGSYEPELDSSKPHLAQIEISMYVSPEQLRGDLIVEALYFEDRDHLQRYRTGDWRASADLRVLTRWSFPDDECEDYELPFAHDAPIELLRGQSADELRSKVTALIGQTTTVDAVWKDDRKTQVTVELGTLLEGTACLGSSSTAGGKQPLPRRGWQLRLPVAGRLRTGDARLDMPINELLLGVQGRTIPRATLGALVRTDALSDAERQALAADADADALQARVFFDFSRKPVLFDGGVDVFHEVQSGVYMPIDCVSFPPGGESDTGSCHYRR